MSSTVVYKGHRDRRDGTTEVQVEVEGKTYLFPRDQIGGEAGKDPGPVPDSVVERLSGDDLKGHRFETEPTESASASLGALNVASLKELATTHGVEVASDARKQDLVAALEGAGVEPTADPQS